MHVCIYIAYIHSQAFANTSLGELPFAMVGKAAVIFKRALGAWPSDRERI